MSKNIRGHSLRSNKSQNDYNPMDGLANLADIMLVFACGLMMALIINWNVDIGLKPVDVSRGKEVTNVEDQKDDLQKVLNTDGGYEKMGVLYKDPVTGKMYILSQE